MSHPSQISGLIIGFCWLLFFGYWIANAFGNKKNLSRKQRPFKGIVLFIFVFVAISILSGSIDKNAIIPYTLFTQTLGIVLCVFGVGWAIWARKSLGTNWSGYPTIKENHQLVQTGPYSYTRHPIYTGWLTAFLGTFFAVLATWTGLGLFILMAIVFILRVPVEERLMTETFPNDYPAYKQRVRVALIPFIF